LRGEGNSNQSAACARAFALPDLLVVLAVLAVLAAIVVPVIVRMNAKTRQARCVSNLKEITRATLLYAADNHGVLPQLQPNAPSPVWWWYKELVKGHAGLTGPSSPKDKLFACPKDRGYDEPRPFCLSPKFAYGSYVFNGVDLPGVPNLAGWPVTSVREPTKTLLMMEWTAHAPLSWHKSRTGRKNHPFYNDAESVVGFVDGRVKFIKIYYDGVNAAYTRDPIPGYEYRYSGQ
jgi:type II secretory pathway pseudopilin PulG